MIARQTHTQIETIIFRNLNDLITLFDAFHMVSNFY